MVSCRSLYDSPEACNNSYKLKYDPKKCIVSVSANRLTGSRGLLLPEENRIGSAVLQSRNDSHCRGGRRQGDALLGEEGAEYNCFTEGTVIVLRRGVTNQHYTITGTYNITKPFSSIFIRSPTSSQDIISTGQAKM